MIHIENKTVSGILTNGGTILGTSRDKIHKMPMGGKVRDMTEVAVENVHRNHIDCLVCLGGGGTMRNALRLHQAGGIDVMTLPKTIDNDVAGTDTTFGHDTAMQIATDAIDRLHSTATSHHRLIVCEIMGHKTGWLALGAGIAGGADVILIPELPYDLQVVKDYLLERRRRGSRFSIMALAEGAVSKQEIEAQQQTPDKEKISKKKTAKKTNSFADKEGQNDTETYRVVEEPIASRIARRIQESTGIEARVTSLGHVQRGGVPSAFDRWLCTRMGTKAAQLLADGVYNVMVGYRSGNCEPVPLEDVAGKRKSIPVDHPLIATARLVGTCLGDRSPFD
jgi:6-phosphofructokinase